MTTPVLCLSRWGAAVRAVMNCDVTVVLMGGMNLGVHPVG
jgi:hypothetical protein